MLTKRSAASGDENVADLGEGPEGPTPLPLPLFSVKKEEMTEGRKADWASNYSRAQGLKVWIRHWGVWMLLREVFVRVSHMHFMLALC